MDDFHARLRDANEARQQEWDTGNVIDVSWRYNELVGEVGELCNVIKKLHRERMGVAGSRATVDDLRAELADVVICADLYLMTQEEPPCRITGVDRGRCSRLVSYTPSLVAALDYLFDYDRAGKLLHIVAEIAADADIDIRAAVIGKFNATSEKVGLKTRMA